MKSYGRVEIYEGVPKIFRTRRLKRELQMVQLFATKCNCIAIVWVSLVSFAVITLCVASQRVFIAVVVVYFLMTQSGNFWIHPHMKGISRAVICSPPPVTATLGITQTRVFKTRGSYSGHCASRGVSLKFRLRR